MAAYKDREEFEAILSRLWDRILESPEIVESIGGVKIIARFRYTDYPSVLYIDNTGETPRYYWNPAEETKPAEEELETINALPVVLLRRAFNGEL